jgi:hypothetical protein
MSKKLKELKKSFEVEYLIESALDSLKDGDSIEDMLRWVLTSAKADEWLENKYPHIACADREYNDNEVTFTHFQYL